VDDEPEVTIFLADLLHLEGFTVDTARDGADAVSRLEQEQGAYDALLVDLRMPVSGLELLHDIERRFPSLRRRIVFMTADVFYADQHQLRTRGGGPRVMIKPFHAEEVVQALREVLET
jgi:DNA-binding response OmpR family regulator